MFDDDFGQNDYYAFTHKRCKFIGICNAVPGDHVGHLNSEFYRGLRQCSWLEGQLAEEGKSHDHTFAFAHIPLPAGQQTLEIARREDGALLDVIVISKID
ncbi:MAG: hypothetical protein ACYTEK_20635 [Planctomycetota bacterium]